MRWLISVSILVAVLGPSLAGAEDGSALPAPGGFQFPAMVGDLERGAVRRYDAAGENVSVGYRGPKPLQITLYVYADDAACGPGLEAEYGCSRDAIRTHPASELMGTTVATVFLAGGRLPALVGGARLTDSDVVYDSLLLVTRAGAFMVKVRATYPSGALSFPWVADQIGAVLAAASDGFPEPPAWARGAAPVREALALIEASPASRDLNALFRLVVDFAESSPDIQIVLDADHIPVGASDECDALLMGHYVAGAVRFDLDHPERAGDPTADVVPALEAVLRYQGKAGAPDCATPLLERIQALAKAGQLATLVEPGAARRAE